MNRLSRIILLLSVALAAVIARMVIGGSKPLGGLTGAMLADAQTERPLPGREDSYSSWRDVTLCCAGASAAP